MDRMNRALRVLGLIALLCIGFFVFLSQLPLGSQTVGEGVPESGDLLRPALPALLVNLIGQTTFALCLGVGIAALVACFQRGQLGWAIGLIVLLLVAANGSYLVLELAPLLGDGQFFAVALVGALLPEALVPLAVLAYTFIPHPRLLAPQPIQPTPIVE